MSPLTDRRQADAQAQRSGQTPRLDHCTPSTSCWPTSRRCANIVELDNVAGPSPSNRYAGAAGEVKTPGGRYWRLRRNGLLGMSASPSHAPTGRRTRRAIAPPRFRDFSCKLDTAGEPVRTLVGKSDAAAQAKFALVEAARGTSATTGFAGAYHARKAASAASITLRRAMATPAAREPAALVTLLSAAQRWCEGSTSIGLVVLRCIQVLGYGIPGETQRQHSASSNNLRDRFGILRAVVDLRNALYRDLRPARLLVLRVDRSSRHSRERPGMYADFRQSWATAKIRLLVLPTRG